MSDVNAPHAVGRVQELVRTSSPRCKLASMLLSHDSISFSLVSSVECIPTSVQQAPEFMLRHRLRGFSGRYNRTPYASEEVHATLRGPSDEPCDGTPRGAVAEIQRN